MEAAMEKKNMEIQAINRQTLGQRLTDAAHCL